MALKLTDIDQDDQPELALKLAYKRLRFSLTQSPAGRKLRAALV